MLLRAAAVAIALAAVVDPAVSRPTAVPLPVDVLMPPDSDPRFENARELHERIVARLADRVTLDGPEEPQAFIALGTAAVPSSLSAPVFGMRLTNRPALAIESVRTVPTIVGQSAPVIVTLRGEGLAGRTTSLALERNGVAVQSIEHKWTADDENFVARLGFVPGGTGVHRVRVRATASGLDAEASADVAVAVRDRRLRVLAYEPRPSWPLTFVRRSLEADPIFDVETTVRTTGRSATSTPGAPESLAALQAERFDAVIVGAPEALSATELRSLDTFVARRGGTLLLLPDRRLPESVRRGFDLPEFEEAVLERPLTTQGPGPRLRSSELLLVRSATGVEPLAVVRHGSGERTVIGTILRGDGRIILSGAMDAWRYRGDPDAAFDTFWRGLVADAAAAAPPRLAVTVQPQLAHPGEEVSVSVSVRATEFDDEGGSVEVPSITAQLLGADGEKEMIRLWPGVAPGMYAGHVRPARAGAYSVSVRIDNGSGASADAPWLVAEDIIHASSSSARALTFAAASSGGAVVGDLDDLARRLEALKAADVETRTRPMRSPWWIVPFAGLLCAEWALRRRAGGR